jgi:hypothetical protein
MDPALVQFFDLVCDRLAAHESYSVKIGKAVGADEPLILNYHTHGPDQTYCVSVCIESRASAELQPTLEELAHIRGIGATRKDCGPRMAAFAARLVERYALKRAPVVYLDGVPFARP